MDQPALTESSALQTVTILLSKTMCWTGLTVFLLHDPPDVHQQAVWQSIESVQ